MSLSSIKQKETKGKKNVLPKLTSVLGEPYRKQCPVLKERELDELRQILKNVVSSSEQSPREFATANNIQIGLESSLRFINRSQVSCVFISLSLKPHHLISLIARNSELKDATVPVFVQPKLEKFTEEIFGIRAMTLIFPKNLLHLDSDLDNWVSARKRPERPRVNKPKPVIPIGKKLNIPSTSSSAVASAPEEIKLEKQVTFKKPSTAKSKQWVASDYISFGNAEENVKLDQTQLNEDKSILSHTLSDLVEKAKELHTGTDAQTQQPDTANISTDEMQPPDFEAANEDDGIDDFLDGVFRPLTVLHFHTRPSKKPKKKKQKKTNKST